MPDYGPNGPFLADCPARFTIELLSAKWSAVVLSALSSGPMRRRDLLSLIGGVSGRVLTETLHRLEELGLVEHHRTRQAPPRVDYSLTPLGETLLEPIRVLNDWALEHGGDVPTPTPATP